MERILLFILLNLVLLEVYASDNIPEPPMNPNGTVWAVLVAGSYGWDNYRHQADICHAYQTLHNNGIPDKNIIVMMYDDIAFHKDNPTPGVIINYPDGPNVYNGVPKDYTRENVNSENFFAVLTGRKSGTDGIGSGKVIESGPEDVVFVNYVGHGGIGVLGLPEDDIFADEFVKSIDFMYTKSKYSKLIIYIESSLRGSIFGDLLLDTKKVFALTSAHSHANSQATFYDEKRKTFLTDVFNYAWMDDIESESLRDKTVLQQDTNLLTLTSHVEDYSDLNIGERKLKDVLVYKKLLMAKTEGLNLSSSNMNTERPLMDTTDNIDVSHVILQNKLFATEDPEERSILKFEINEVLNKRKVIDQTFNKLIVRATGNISERKNELEISRYRLSRDNSLCYKTLYSTFSNNRITFHQNPYARAHLQKLVNMCSVNWLKGDEVLQAKLFTWSTWLTPHSPFYRHLKPRFVPLYSALADPRDCKLAPYPTDCTYNTEISAKTESSEATEFLDWPDMPQCPDSSESTERTGTSNLTNDPEYTDIPNWPSVRDCFDNSECTKIPDCPDSSESDRSECKEITDITESSASKVSTASTTSRASTSTTISIASTASITSKVASTSSTASTESSATLVSTVSSSAITDGTSCRTDCYHPIIDSAETTTPSEHLHETTTENPCDKIDCSMFGNSESFPCPNMSKVSHKNCTIDVPVDNPEIGNWTITCQFNTLHLACATGEAIKIHEATWGIFDSICYDYPDLYKNCSTVDDTLFRLKERCEGKGHCSIYVGLQLSNPCQTYEKYLSVRWSCEPVPTNLVFPCLICDGTDHRLKCYKGSYIFIYSIFWGRTSESFCDFEDSVQKNCSSLVALDKISGSCDYREECLIEAKADVLGDPCPGIKKYLKLYHRCIVVSEIIEKVCPDEVLKIDCGKKQIFITQAYYGRSHPYVCHHYFNPGGSTDCVNFDITTKIGRRCNGKSACTVHNTINELGSHCRKYTNYLSVNIICRNPSEDIPDVLPNIVNVWVRLAGPVIIVNITEYSVTFYVDWIIKKFNHLYVVQMKLASENTWHEVLVGQNVDFTKELEIEGFEPGTTYEIRVVLKNCRCCDDTCIPFTRFITLHLCCWAYYGPNRALRDPKFLISYSGTVLNVLPQNYEPKTL